jgi:8-oxo-dGTP pyrophosphatase MutT (NUDIX family)
MVSIRNLLLTSELNARQEKTMSEFNELAKYLTRSEPKIKGVYKRPRDAATLIVLDRSEPDARLLLGKRHESHAFMPGFFVFPGGRLDDEDRRMKYVGALDAASERRLLAGSPRISPTRVRALALAAIRETCEETGILLGRRNDSELKAPTEAWKPFVDAGAHPNLGALTFIARAITPPGRPRRFDTRFFVADRSDAAAELPNIAGPDAEFVELKWLTIQEAAKEKVPAITKVILEELEARLKAGFPKEMPAPFFYSKNGKFHRDELA